jgi:hypothetical protein
LLVVFVASLVVAAMAIAFVANRKGARPVRAVAGTVQTITLDGTCNFYWRDVEGDVTWEVDVHDWTEEERYARIGERLSPLRRGTIRFETDESGVFTNEAGAHVTLRRSKSTFYAADCAVRSRTFRR